MVETSYDKEIEILEEELKRVQEKLSYLRQRQAIHVCPYEIGQTLTDRKGKMAIVDSILPSWDSGYKLIGRHYLKSGKLGSMGHELYSWDEWDALK